MFEDDKHKSNITLQLNLVFMFTILYSHAMAMVHTNLESTRPIYSTAK